MFVATVAVTVMSGVMLASVAYVARREVSSSVAESSERANAALSTLVKKRQETLLAEAKLLAGMPDLSSVVLSKDIPSIEQATRRYYSTSAAGWLVFTDVDGSYLGGIGPGGTKVTGWQPGETVRAATAGQDARGKIIIGGKVAMAATVPIIVGDAPQGTLTVAMPINDDLAREIASAARTDIAFFSGRTVLGSSIPLGSDDLSSIHNDTVTVRGKSYAAATGALPGVWGGQPLTFTSLFDTSRIEGPFNTIQHVLELIFAVSTVTALAMGYTLASRLTQPLEALVSAAKELQSGRWPEPTPTKRRDEIGLLQTVFDETVVSLRASQESLLQMIYIDPLTRLLNHSSFRDRLASEVLAAQTGERELCLVVVDLDNFEEFNAAQGREAGDVALVTVADILRTWAGDKCTVARYGGNEFAVICPDARAEETGYAFQHLLEEIYVRTGVTASAGVAANTDAMTRPDLLVLAATLAVQQAKVAGKNRCRTYDGEVTASTMDDLRSFLQGGSYAAVRALAEAVDAKDQYTRGHSQRVAEYARDLARAAGYDDGFVELVFMTGTLHDVGKIGVPDHVLHKDGKLTDEEFEMVKLHPELGEKIVSQIATLGDTLPGIRHHHERYDGGGYPDGLAGDDIPLIARILAVADTFDAMTSDRPYRKGMPVDIALTEIARTAGTQFDPSLASLFVLLRKRDLAA